MDRIPRKTGNTEYYKRCEKIASTLSGIQDGLCLVSSASVTSSIFTNSDEKEMHVNFSGMVGKI